jgi:hypothetical protein
MGKTTEAGSELVVVTKSKDLLEYVLTVTQKSPEVARGCFPCQPKTSTVNFVS